MRSLSGHPSSSIPIASPREFFVLIWMPRFNRAEGWCSVTYRFHPIRDRAHTASQAKNLDQFCNGPDVQPKLLVEYLAQCSALRPYARGNRNCA